MQVCRKDIIMGLFLISSPRMAANRIEPIECSPPFIRLAALPMSSNVTNSCSLSLPLSRSPSISLYLSLQIVVQALQEKVKERLKERKIERGRESVQCASGAKEDKRGCFSDILWVPERLTRTQRWDGRRSRSPGLWMRGTARYVIFNFSLFHPLP